MSTNADIEILNELRELTKDKENWKANIDDVALKLNYDYSADVKAKALWLLGEMGLKYPEEIECHVKDIASYLEDNDPKLRERSANAIGRIGRADNDLVIVYMDKLMKLKDDESFNVRHAFIWACENIATSNPDLFCDKLDIFYEMISDSEDKVRIEAPEMFRVIGKTRPNFENISSYLKQSFSIFCSYFNNFRLFNIQFFSYFSYDVFYVQWCIHFPSFFFWR